MANGNERRLVVLDRDGVINRESKDFIRTPDEWLPLPGSIEAIARLTQTGFTVVVATNQSGVGRGLFTAETLAEIHSRMTTAVESGVAGSPASLSARTAPMMAASAASRCRDCCGRSRRHSVCPFGASR